MTLCHDVSCKSLLAEQAQLGSWTAHPLNKALLAQPLTHSSLLLGAQRILTKAAQTGEHAQQLLQQLLSPFVSFVMLRPDVSGKLDVSVHLLVCKPDCHSSIPCHSVFTSTDCQQNIVQRLQSQSGQQAALLCLPCVLQFLLQRCACPLHVQASGCHTLQAAC